MGYDETIKDIEKTFGTVPGFMKETPKDILPQMWPMFKKYQLGESVIPQKFREMMMLAGGCEMSLLSNISQRGFKDVGATDEELNELAAVVGLTAFWSNVLHTQNYDYNTFVKELKEMGEYMEKNRRN